VVGKFNVSTGTVYQRNKPVLQFNMTEGEEFHIPSFSWMDERGEVIASQTTTTSDAAKPAPQELAATWHLNQLDGTEFTNTKSWMATEFAFAGNKRGTVNSDPITELQTSTRSLHEGRYALFLESEDAAYRSWADPAHEVLNYVGILDPFGVADGINAIWYVGEGLMGREGAFLNAGISAAGALLPYVGDLLKFGKAGVKAAEACGVFQKLETKAILKQSAKSAAIGAASGAAIGGTVSHVAGGDVWHGATQGALHGAVGGFSRGFFLNRFAQACFTAGTPLVVDLEGNSKPIEEIQVGEMVLARNEFEPHGPLELKRVEELFTRTSPIIELEIGGQKIGTTDEHPFYVPAREAFVPARELQAGDQLISHDGRLLRIDAIQSTLQIATVYNLRVADYHTYFVGGALWGFSVWAHNAGCGPNAERWMKSLTEKYGVHNVQIVAPKRFVTDGNLFMDKPIIEGGQNVRHLFDDVLEDVASSRSREIILPSFVKAEIKATTTQLARLDSVAHQVQVVRTDVDTIIATNPGILSGKFGRADLQLLETARVLGLPVLTSNSAIRNQIANHAGRKALYGNLDIFVPGQTLSNSTHLMTVLSAQP
jgi:hypothetical protein